MIYIYRRKVSESARELADGSSLNARYIRDLTKPHFGKGLRPGDHLICWGERVAPIEGVKILNGGPLSTKFEDAQKLRAENVPTIEASLSRGAVTNVEPFQNRLNQIGSDMATSLEDADYEAVFQRIPDFTAARAALLAALADPSRNREWVGRMNDHIGGNDLLNPPSRPDFYTLKVRLDREVRIHSFLGRSIRAGVKVPREGVTPHPWIRSFDGGWRIQYDGFESTEEMRKLAAAACKALGLDFGAVDMGIKPDGGLIVLEVNRAPGLEGGSVEAYAKALARWVEGEEPKKVKAPKAGSTRRVIEGRAA